nr:PREDICTED: uncharacterized protein LOC109035256 isoform X2 [Bemisia tabaci]
MRSYEEKTCVRFKERSGEKDFVRIISSSGLKKGFSGHADLGRIGGEQMVTIGQWNMNTVLHELGHTVGLIDEHMRPDRDLYMEVLQDNIFPNLLPAFDKEENPNRVNLLGEPLDFDSVMMYGEYAGSSNGEPAFRAKSGRRVPERHELSAGDIRRIDDLYRCNGTFPKPRFPFDIVCDFDEDDCNFRLKKNGKGTWSWLQLDKKDFLGGYLLSKMEPKNDTLLADYVFSVNFHGLSPIDIKRGPIGCVEFGYMTKTCGRRKPPYLQLFKVDLNSTLDDRYDPERSYQIWSSPKKFNETSNKVWIDISIRVNVIEPFVLIFKTIFASRKRPDWVIVDNLIVKYTPCRSPEAVEGFKPRPQKQSFYNRAYNRVFGSTPKTFTPGLPDPKPWRSLWGLLPKQPPSKSSTPNSSVLSSWRRRFSRSSLRRRFSGSSLRRRVSGLFRKKPSSESPTPGSPSELPTPESPSKPSVRKRLAGIFSRKSSSTSPASESSSRPSLRKRWAGIFSRKSSSTPTASESTESTPSSSLKPNMTSIFRNPFGRIRKRSKSNSEKV